MPAREIQSIIRVGNSSAVIIPAHIMRALGWGRGDSVVFAVYSDNEVCIRKLDPRALAEMKPRDPIHA